MVSILPIAIKGGELIHYGNQKHFGLASFVNKKVQGQNTVLAESWVMQCTLKPDVAYLGKILLAVGLSAMLLGITLEILAIVFTKKLKTKWQAIQMGKDHGKDFGDINAGLLWYLGQDKIAKE